MKIIILFALIIWSINSICQPPLKARSAGVEVVASSEIEIDTTLKIINASKKINLQKQPAYFLNGELVSSTLISNLDPKLIDSINVVNGKIEIDNIEYYGQYRVKTKNNYSPKIISLAEIKKKYTALKNKPAIFMIDGIIINDDYNNYYVDENYLLRIIIDKVENKKERINIGFIKILLRTKKNIEDLKIIRIC
ncbi:MAG: hypothetical protein V4556_08180 [Bacteroidota bacterium]